MSPSTSFKSAVPRVKPYSIPSYPPGHFAQRLLAGMRVKGQVMLAMSVLVAIDFLLTLVNFAEIAVQQLVRWEGSPDTIPAAFSPFSPPPLLSLPGTHVLCRLVYLYECLQSVRSGYEKTQPHGLPAQNRWVRDWTVWAGIGHKGQWPEARRPAETDSRCPCPALNALANHGIINPSGKDITASQLLTALSRTYNLSPGFALQLYSPFFHIFAERNHVFDLSDIGAIKVVEHDASLLRPDLFSAEMERDIHAFIHPCPALTDRVFPTDKKVLDRHHFAAALTTRRMESRQTNGQFDLSPMHKLISAGSCGLMMWVFRGDVNVLRHLAGVPTQVDHDEGYEYGAERLAKGWQPPSKVNGLTFWEILVRALRVESLCDG